MLRIQITICVAIGPFGELSSQDQLYILLFSLYRTFHVTSNRKSYQKQLSIVNFSQKGTYITHFQANPEHLVAFSKQPYV